MVTWPIEENSAELLERSTFTSWNDSI
jgi:hypothetical protein